MLKKTYALDYFKFEAYFANSKKELESCYVDELGNKFTGKELNEEFNNYINITIKEWKENIEEYNIPMLIYHFSKKYDKNNPKFYFDARKKRITNN